MKFFEKHPMIMVAVGILGLSMSAVLVKYSHGPSLAVASYRLIWTVGLMSPVVLLCPAYRKELFAADRSMILLCAVSGIFLALHFTTWFESLKHTSVASSTTIVCTEVIWVALGYRIFLKGRISKKAAFSILVTLLGSVTIALSDYSSGGSHFYGDFLALTAAVLEAGYTLIGRVVRARLNASTTVYTYVVYFFCGLTLILASVATSTPLTGYGWNDVVIGLLLCLFSTLLGHSIFSWCLKFLSPAFLSVSKLCEPVVAAVFAMVLFHEFPVPLQIIGGAVIIVGVYLYSRVEKEED